MRLENHWPGAQPGAQAGYWQPQRASRDRDGISGRRSHDYHLTHSRTQRLAGKGAFLLGGGQHLVDLTSEQLLHFYPAVAGWGRSGVSNPRDSFWVAQGETAPSCRPLRGEQLSVCQVRDGWAGKQLKRGSFHPDPQNRVSNGKSDRPFTVVALLGAAIILSS